MKLPIFWRLLGMLSWQYEGQRNLNFLRGLRRGSWIENGRPLSALCTQMMAPKS
jgi:hypothetical protein